MSELAEILFLAHLLTIMGSNQIPSDEAPCLWYQIRTRYWKSAAYDYTSNRTEFFYQIQAGYSDYKSGMNRGFLIYRNEGAYLNHGSGINRLQIK